MKKLLPIVLVLLVLVGLALARDSIAYESGGLIPGKLELIIEAVIVVVLMLVRGFSDPEWKTTFFNLTNLVGVMQAINTVVVFFNPGGIPEAWQSMVARLLAFLATLLFARKASVVARFVSAVHVIAGKPNSEIPATPTS